MECVSDRVRGEVTAVLPVPLWHLAGGLEEDCSPPPIQGLDVSRCGVCSSLGGRPSAVGWVVGHAKGFVHTGVSHLNSEDLDLSL